MINFVFILSHDYVYFYFYEECAENVNLANTLASATLKLPPRHRVINPNLSHSIPPPWGQLNPSEWNKTPINPPTDLRGNQLIDSRTPVGNHLPLSELAGGQPKSKEETPPHLQVRKVI